MLTIRRGQLSDLPAVLDLLSRVWEDDYVPECWADWAANPEEGIVLVALLDDQIVGTCYVHFQGSDQCWFQAMRVHPEYRRLGVGSALTQRSLEDARSRDRRVAYLGIDADNVASQTMTARAGFRKITAYQRLHAGLGSHHSSGQWREATAADAEQIVGMYRAHAKRNDLPEALFNEWEWQELSEAAVMDAIMGKKLWVWRDRDSDMVCSGISFYHDEVGVFAPVYDTKDELIRALSSLQPLAVERGATRMELWLPVADQALPELVERYGIKYEPEDAYVIWGYDLRT